MKDLILSNPKNRGVLEYLDPSREQEYFSWWKDSGFDEGARVFYFEYGVNLPIGTRYSFGIYNLLVCESNGLIFGFQQGRFSFFVRNENVYGVNESRSKVIASMDGDLDVSKLGSDWFFLFHAAEEGEEASCYREAYDLACRT